MALTPSVNDKLLKVGTPIASTTLDSPGYTQNQTGPITVISTTGWPTDTQTVFAMDRVTTVTENGVTKTVRINGTYTEYTAIVTSSTQFSNVKRTYGASQDYPSGSTTRIYNPITSTRENLLIDGLAGDSGVLNLDGSLKNAVITASKIANGAITNAQIGAGVINYTNLLSTIFGSQVQTFTNTGANVGSFSYVNVGGIKILWGNFNAVTATGTNLVSLVLNFPAGLFTATPLAVVGNNLPTVTSNWNIYVNNISTTQVGVGVQNNTSSTATNSPSIIVFGV